MGYLRVHELINETALPFPSSIPAGERRKLEVSRETNLCRKEEEEGGKEIAGTFYVLLLGLAEEVREEEKGTMNFGLSTHKQVSLIKTPLQKCMFEIGS